MVNLKEVDLARIEFKKTPECSEFCTHPDIDANSWYLAKIDSGWHIGRFEKVWFGLTLNIGVTWIQLAYRHIEGWRPGFAELYKLEGG